MKIIATDKEKCVGCNRCIRVCPSEIANTAYLDENDNIKVRAENDYCIECGSCLAVCAHGARYYTDDTERFFADLEAGKDIIAIAAPAFKTDFDEWPRIITMLKKFGVKQIYDVSFGADICIWAHLKYMDLHSGVPIITQPCPAIVSYIEKYRRELVPYLSPVHSPMACLAIYLRKHLGQNAAVAALSPCIAKTSEHHATGQIEYNITFNKLAEFIADHDITLPTNESGFDGEDAGLGSLFPVPGGLMENIRFFRGSELRIDVNEGPSVYDSLDEYAVTDEAYLPDIFDILNCEGGCAIGTGVHGDKNSFLVNTQMNVTRSAKKSKQEARIHRQRLKAYDDSLVLGDFLRSYEDVVAPLPQITEDEIQHAFMQMNKDDDFKQSFNCGACGSHTCREMARKVALGVNLPENCIVKSRDEAHTAHIRNENYLAFIRDVAEHLLTTSEGEDFSRVVTLCLKRLYDIMDNVQTTSIWRCTQQNGLFKYTRAYGYFGDLDEKRAGIRGEWPTEWTDKLRDGNHVFLDIEDMPPQYRKLFNAQLKTLLLVPMVLHEEFWGFIVMSNHQRFALSDNDIFIVATCGLLIISSIIEHELSDRLELASKEATSANAAKSDFLFSMSHEMRTPLNAVIGMAQIAKNTDDLKQIYHALSTIDEYSKHLLGLINNILDMSKIESGKIEIEQKPFDLYAMLHRVVDIVKVKADKTGLSVSLDVSENLQGMFVGDELKLSQIITNLMGNAVKFTLEGGSVTLRAFEVATSNENFSDHTLLRFEIADTGIGITDEQRTRLFNPFEQADSSITRRFGGTGLGLSISKRFIEKMGGFIDVESTPGKGSVFFFELELVRAPQADENLTNASQDTAPDFTGLSLLLVEDMEINREIFIAMLDGLGVEIFEAENGQIAINMYEAEPEKYDIIVMDIQMPVMDGYTATEIIRKSKLPHAADIPIIAMTANAFKEDIDRSIKSGMNAHISKPVDRSDLLNTLARFYNGL